MGKRAGRAFHDRTQGGVACLACTESEATASLLLQLRLSGEKRLKNRSGGNRVRRDAGAGERAATVRRPFLGEATLIAGVTAVAYMVALAYRVGGLMRLQLPLSLATVRLTDAAVAGLVVLVGGFLVFLLIDLIESWREGVLQRAWLAMLFASVLGVVVVTGLITLAFVFTLWTYAGLGWAILAFVIIAVCAAIVADVLRRAFSVVSAISPSRLVLIRALERHPAAASAVLLAALLCAGSLLFGFGGISIGRTAYVRTAGTNEVAISMFEDRVILAGIEPTASEEATLTGSLRVVALPSDEVVFSTKRVYELRPQQH